MKYFQLVWVALLCASLNVYGQSIPNNGFETWNNPDGYNVPEGWSTFNELTTSLNIYTCMKGIPGSPGASYIKLISKSVPGFGVVPGMAVAGSVDLSQLNSMGGFAYSNTPTALNGKWQYMGGTTSDIGYISVVLTKWDSGMNMRDTIGEGMVDLDGMAMSWSNFSIPISYLSNESPDSCSIILSASGPNPVANSYLYVDNLAFAGVTAVEEKLSQLATEVFPNPITNELNLILPGDLSNESLDVFIYNQFGQIVRRLATVKSEIQRIDTSALSPGMYYLRIESSKGRSIHKITKL